VRRRVPGWVVWTSSVAVAAVIVLAIPTVNLSLLRALGSVLVNDDPIEPVDVIVIATGADGAGVLEAADLIHRGVSSKVAVFSDPPDAVDNEFIRRGVQYFNETEVNVRHLRALGVASILVIPRTVAGTEDEGRVLPDWSDQEGWRSIIVVGMPDHSRRMRRVLSRAMRNHSTRVMIRSSRYAPFDPGQWWQSRDGTRTEIIELEKLILDIARHPFS
jgi:hypothetical protein